MNLGLSLPVQIILAALDPGCDFSKRQQHVANLRIAPSLDKRLDLANELVMGI